MKKFLFFVGLCQILNYSAMYAQDLELILENELNDSIQTDFVSGTFKTSRLINSTTVEQASKNEMNIYISHRFGTVNKGFRNFFGLDESANIRIGFEYGISDKLTVGLGRNKINKLYDIYFQYKIFGQQNGMRNIPLTMSFKGGTAINTEAKIETVKNYGIYRFNYYATFLFASKITQRISVQLMPIWIHQNLVKTEADKNDVYAVGLGGRVKLTKRMSITTEYYYVLPNQISDTYFNPLSVGLEIETGGHVFQLFASNSLGMTEKTFIPHTEFSWTKGDVLIGFNICRSF
jgi:opacity protein-like surface antigen